MTNCKHQNTSCKNFRYLCCLWKSLVPFEKYLVKYFKTYFHVFFRYVFLYLNFQYFDCEYGHGIMVPMSKVRKLKDFSKKENKSTEKTRTMRSKSISDIHRLKLRDENGKTLRKVSPGYDYIKRSKSSSRIGFKFLL